MLCASEFKSRLGHFLNPLLLIVSCQFLSISLYRYSPEIKSVCWKLSCENYVCVSLSAEACFSGDTVSACLCSLSLWWWPSLSLSHSKPPQEMSIGWGAEKAPWLTFNQASVMEKTQMTLHFAVCTVPGKWKWNGPFLKTKRHYTCLPDVCCWVAQHFSYRREQTLKQRP